MKILILGGSGFIGINIVNFLDSQNIEYLATSTKIKKKQKFIKYNLNEKLPQKIIEFKPNIIIALSWYGIPELNKKNSSINLKMYKNFLKELKKLKYLNKIIFAGSCFEYQIKKNQINDLKESAKHISPTSFSITKNKINLLFKNYCKKEKISFIWLRIFYIYGPFQRQLSIIPTFIYNLRANKKTNIINPNKSIDFIHMEDFLRLILIIIKNNKFIIGKFNCGSGEATKLSNVFLMVKSHTKSKIEQKFDDNKGDQTIMYANITKVKKYFLWKPNININIGIKKTVNNEI